MDAHIENNVLIREYNEDRDIEVVERLERHCATGSRKGISIFTNMMGDPLCRIRLYPTHVMLVGGRWIPCLISCQTILTGKLMNLYSKSSFILCPSMGSLVTLVAEQVGNGEVVGVVRGCIKCVGTGFEGIQATMGCILGLRVSPRHRRKGIGLKLVKSIEGWAIQNGAQYICLAAEESNVASTSLFVLKCNYVKLSSLVILIQPTHSRARDPVSRSAKIEKLSIEQAISLYKNRLGRKGLFPVDIEAILNDKLSLGTWVSFFEEEDWVGLHRKENKEELTIRTPRSWAILSIWKTYEAYKLQIRRQHSFKCFHATLSHAGAKVFPCLRTPTCDLLHRSFGFLFLYGIYGEGEGLGELMKSLWYFAYNLAGNVKDCKMIITEIGVCDPLREHVPKGTSMSCINDFWYCKKVNGTNDDDDAWMQTQPIRNLFVDPRDF